MAASTVWGPHRLEAVLAWQLAKRARPGVWLNFLHYHLAVGRARSRGPDKLRYLPPSVLVWVTRRCNKTCAYCTYRGDLNRENTAEYEMTFERFQQILALPDVRAAMRICLYGGEPFLNKDLFRMVEAVKASGRLANIYTNGLLIVKRLDELVRGKPDWLSISYNSEDHDALEEAVPLAARHMPVKLSMVLTEDRLDRVRPVVELAHRAHAYEVLFTRMDESPDRKNASPLEPADPRVVALQQEIDREFGRFLTIRWHAPLIRRRDEPGHCCMQPWRNLHVDAKGQVLPCCAAPASAFALPDGEGASLWNSPVLLQIRAALRQNTLPPGCHGCSELLGSTMDI